MSGTPNKRVHEESAGHPSIRYSHTQDDPGPYSSVGTPNSKLANPSVPGDYHAASFDIGQDARMPKVARTEARELDARRSSPLVQMYRMQQPPPSVSESQSDHGVNTEDRVEPRDLKVDSVRDVKVGESKDKDVRYTSRVDDHSKDTKYERDSYSDYRNELKTDKEAYNPANSHINWKDSKEHHRAWKYPDATSGGTMDSWHVSRNSTVHAQVEAARENIPSEDKDYTEGVVSETKGDDRVKDRDRKRKDVKLHREWGGENSKERTESRNNESKDPPMKEKEEKESDRKDVTLKENKDKFKEKEKDHNNINNAKREPWVVNEKEGEKEDAVDVSSRAQEQDNLTMEQRGKQKSTENWKDLEDKEAKDRRVVERDAETEGEKSEKRNKGFDKDSDDGGMDVEGSADRERETFNYGVQQRKRMLRPRGSPQLANRDPRFRSRPQDSEGSTGKADMSSVVYKVGECMQELIKLWKEYEASTPDKLSENGPTLEIRIPAEHVSATNRQVKGGQLWGTDIYTDDSDLVAVLMHTGYCRPTASPPPPAIQELRATVRVLPPQDSYVSTLRNNVRSRAWGAAIGCSFRVERCYIVKKGGGTIDLEPCLTHTSTVEPTLAPVVVERTMTTRAAASNALRQQRFVREVTLQYNLCNEPWIKYSISAIADKGLKKPLFTSARLKKGEVLYLESRTRRYELCFNGEKMVKAAGDTEGGSTDNNESNLMDVFRWSQCKKPLPQTIMRSIGIPLPPEHLEVLEENLDWEDIQWSQTGVWISEKEYPLSRVHFLSPV